jgi:hypothetical protein
MTSRSDRLSFSTFVCNTAQQGVYLEVDSFDLWRPYEHFMRSRERNDFYYGYPEPFAQRLNDPTALNNHQRFVLTVIVNNHLFWSRPTNLFSFFYGLSDSREELIKLLET